MVWPGPARMTYAELLGDLVQPWATRSSQCITDAPFQLGVDDGPTAVLATGLGPSNARIHPLADHHALELGEDAHSSGTWPCPQASWYRCPADAGTDRSCATRRDFGRRPEWVAKSLSS